MVKKYCDPEASVHSYNWVWWTQVQVQLCVNLKFLVLIPLRVTYFATRIHSQQWVRIMSGIMSDFLAKGLLVVKDLPGVPHFQSCHCHEAWSASLDDSKDYWAQSQRSRGGQGQLLLLVSNESQGNMFPVVRHELVKSWSEGFLDPCYIWG